jgi:hypothetical protein
VHVRRNLRAHGTESEPKSCKVRSVPLIDQAAREVSRRFVDEPVLGDAQATARYASRPAASSAAA